MKLNSLKKALAIVMVLCTFFVMFEGVGKVNVEAKTKKVTTSVLEKKFNKAPAVKKGTTKVTMKSSIAMYSLQHLPPRHIRLHLVMYMILLIQVRRLMATLL